MWSDNVHTVSNTLLPAHITLSLLSIRLAGFPPFWHRKQLVMLRNIMDGKYKFVSPEWDDISEKAKDLVSFAVDCCATVALAVLHRSGSCW